MRTSAKSLIINRKAPFQECFFNAEKGVDISSINDKEQEVLYKRNYIFYTDNIVEQDDKYYILLK